jgi:hypothetical protein
MTDALAGERKPLISTSDSEECYLAVELKFGTDEEMGIRVDREWGYISAIDEGTQASRLGVEAGSYIMHVNDSEFTEAWLNEVLLRRKPFTLRLKRSDNPDDLLKDKFFHQYKNHMLRWAYWSAVLLAICGGIAVVYAAIGSVDYDGCLKKSRLSIMSSGMVLVAMGVLLWIVQFLAKQDLRKPVNPCPLYCIGASICLISVLLSWILFSMGERCATLANPGVWIIGGVITTMGGGLGVLFVIWYFMGTRAVMGMGFYRPA